MQADASGCNQMQAEVLRESEVLRCNQRSLELGSVREATPTKWSEVVVGVAWARLKSETPGANVCRGGAKQCTSYS